MRKHLIVIGIVLHFLTGSLFAQVPQIASFSPNNGPVGSEVTISGTNFGTDPEDNIVYFGGVKAEVFSSSESELVVEVPVGASNQLISVTVERLTAFSGESFSVLHGGDGTLDNSSFDDFQEISMSASPWITAQGDLDLDGKIDLVVLYDLDSEYRVLKNTSSGPGEISFETAISATTIGTEVYSVLLVDLNGDGWLDMTIGYADEDIYKVTVFMNNGTGSIGFTEFDTDNVDAAPWSMASGDFNGDGKIDIVVTDEDNAEVSILENTTEEWFPSLTRTETDWAVGNSPSKVVVADLNADGLPEIVAANADDHTVSVLKNTSSGGTISFSDKADFAVNSTTTTYWVGIADLDGDAMPDIVTKNYRHISLLRNTSIDSEIDLTLEEHILFNTSSADPILQDLNGDGKSDLILENFLGSLNMSTNTSTVGDISFATGEEVSINIENIPASISSADLDGDGEIDLIIPAFEGGFFGEEYKLGFMRNLNSGTDFVEFTLADETGPATIDVSSHSVNIEVEHSISLENLTSSFETSTSAEVSIGEVLQESGVTANDFTEPIVYTIHAEDGSYSQDWIITVTVACPSDEVEEDIVACGNYTFGDDILSNSGEYVGQFTNVMGCDSVVYLDLTILPAVFHEDVYATTSYEFEGETYTSSGQHIFGPFESSTGCDSTFLLNLTIEPAIYDLQDHMRFSQSEQPFLGAVGMNHLGDLDDDGDLDVIVMGNTATGEVIYKSGIYFNEGDGTYIEASSPFGDITGRPFGSRLLDIDNDDDLDLIVIGFKDLGSILVGHSGIFLNDGKGQFIEKTDTNLPVTTIIFVPLFDAADVDGDLDIDLVISGAGNDQTDVWLNDGNEVFSKVESNDFPDFEDGSVDLFDADNDGDPDLFLSGDPAEGSFITEFYLNDGLGHFTKTENQPFIGTQASTIEFEDIDLDGDLDIFHTGFTSDGINNDYSLIYRNDGHGNFTLDTSSRIPEVEGGDAKFGDLDLDGDPDLVLSGLLDCGKYYCQDTTLIYLNNGHGHFMAHEICGLASLSYTAVSIGDVDGDARPDFLLNGRADGDPQTILYLNKETSNDLILESCGPFELDGALITESGEYEGFYTDDFGCSFFAYINLTVHEELSTEFTAHADHFTAQEELAEYQWLKCIEGEYEAIAGANGRQFVATEIGNYALEVSNSVCTLVSECYHYDGLVLSSRSSLVDVQPIVYPNPTSEIVNLDLGQEMDDVSIEIVDMTGKLLISECLGKADQMQIRMPNRSGLYLLKVNSHSKLMYSTRIIRK